MQKFIILFLLLCFGCSSYNKNIQSEAFLLVREANKNATVEDLKIIENSLINSGHFNDFQEFVKKGYILYIHPEKDKENIVVLIRHRDISQAGCGGNYLINPKELKALLESGEGSRAFIKKDRLQIPNPACSKKN